jgi:hypothetical protein
MKLLFPLIASPSLSDVRAGLQVASNVRKLNSIKEECLCVPIIAILLFLCSCCSSLIDGPFNKNEIFVPQLLYANNESNLVTFWDEDLQTYRTYDQQLNLFLNTAIFNIDKSEGRSTNYKVAGLSVAPLTLLDEQGLLTQDVDGCIACHQR